METKTIATKLDMLKFLLNFEGCFVADVVGKKGGLITWWKINAQVWVLNFSQCHIMVVVKDEHQH